MRVLFLDIDGVLNSTSWQQRRIRPPNISQYAGWLRDAEDGLDPDAVARLNHIVEVTGAVVVLSSTWRKSEPLTAVTRMLRYRGFAYRLFAATPHLVEPPSPSGAYKNRYRGDEILDWINMVEHAGGVVTQFAILDDDSDMASVAPALVQTDFEVGLTDADAARAIQLLRRR